MKYIDGALEQCPNRTLLFFFPLFFDMFYDNEAAQTCRHR